ncbi:right-handed parallel beta-helix repeat-containing protein [Cellulomonas telluris]|uniref:right-handed parallel beta-helix repeat-containing protein n=1 Tax=Cellulomonas telluris TaxID=2306636 RepID=UPI0010A7D588|nr:right-handed parallel beta-helix repeat-containing protein [Cellulomonas telluris]
MRTRSLLAVGAALGMVVTFATSAAAAPPPCPGFVQKGPNHYRLVADSTCDLGVLPSGTTVDLAGRTLTSPGSGGSGTVVGGSDVTLARGHLRANSIYWAGERGRLDRVDVTSVVPGAATGAFLTAGAPGMVVTRSHFHDLPGTAVDFYHAGQGRVSDSRFTRNGIAVAIQKRDGFVVERSTFVGNQTGVFLRNEDGAGANDVAVADNVFKASSGAGIRVVLRKSYFQSAARGLDDVQLLRNRLIDNGGPGIDVTVECSTEEAECTLGQSSITVTGNALRHNGFAPSAGLGDDGISARTLVGGPGAAPGTAGLSVVTVTGNRSDRNADRGYDVAGVTDGGGNTARRNADPQQCLGVVCP